MIKLREAELYDTRQITLLALKYFDDLTYDGFYMEAHENIKSDDGVIYVLVQDETIIAFTQCKIQKGGPAILKRICVEEEYINKQAGEKLVKKCAQWAKRKGCDTLLYNCVQEQRADIKAHNRLGFDEHKRIAL